MPSKKLLNKIKQLVKPFYKQIQGWGHGWPHIVRVVKAAEELAKMENVDPVLCQIAAYCHDLGRLEEENKKLVNPKLGYLGSHAEMSVAPTKNILKQVKIDNESAEKIIEAVRVHNIRTYKGNNEIAKILQDADRSDGYGKFAILRFAVFNCNIKLPEPKNESQIEKLLKRVYEVLKQDKSKRMKMEETIEYVFEWVDVLANTRSLKKYVQFNYDFSRKFYNRLKQL